MRRSRFVFCALLCALFFCAPRSPSRARFRSLAHAPLYLGIAQFPPLRPSPPRAAPRRPAPRFPPCYLRHACACLKRARLADILRPPAFCCAAAFALRGVSTPPRRFKQAQKNAADSPAGACFWKVRAGYFTVTLRRSWSLSSWNSRRIFSASSETFMRSMLELTTAGASKSASGS